MKCGSVALARIQQSDGRLKLRPVVILTTMPPYSDVLVCAISSKLHHKTKDFDDVIDVGAADFESSGLKTSSLIRLGLVATIPRTAIEGELGVISYERLLRLRERLADHIKAESGSGSHH